MSNSMVVDGHGEFACHNNNHQHREFPKRSTMQQRLMSPTDIAIYRRTLRNSITPANSANNNNGDRNRVSGSAPKLFDSVIDEEGPNYEEEEIDDDQWYNDQIIDCDGIGLDDSDSEDSFFGGCRGGGGGQLKSLSSFVHCNGSMTNLVMNEKHQAMDEMQKFCTDLSTHPLSTHALLNLFMALVKFKVCLIRVAK